MLSKRQLSRLQREQFSHDTRNHSDIWCLHKADRLKHYGLHFAKYCGRIARGAECEMPIERTLTDMTLVSLSAANTLHQDLSKIEIPDMKFDVQLDPLRPLADAAGRFADACEKIDHLEEFTSIACRANLDVFAWAIFESKERQFNLISDTYVW